ncbi:MAG: hypothetical protein AB1938_10895 [Myxococcota bacterium]
MRLVLALSSLVLLVGCGRGPDGCYRGGCSGQLCTETPFLASTCEWAPHYACYGTAACERQPDGACGFTPSPALTACLADAGGL